MTPQAEYGPDVFHPTDDDHDPDRVVRDAERNSRIARGADLAFSVHRELRDSENDHWEARCYTKDGHKIAGLGSTMATALIALADMVDNTNTQEK